MTTKESCNHEAMPTYFSINNQNLKCAKCGVKLRLSDDQYHDFIFAKNAYRNDKDKIIYKFIEVEE